MFESCVGYSRVFLFIFVLIHIHHAVNMYPDLIGYLFFRISSLQELYAIYGNQHIKTSTSGVEKIVDKLKES